MTQINLQVAYTPQNPWEHAQYSIVREICSKITIQFKMSQTFTHIHICNLNQYKINDQIYHQTGSQQAALHSYCIVLYTSNPSYKTVCNIPHETLTIISYVSGNAITLTVINYKSILAFWSSWFHCINTGIVQTSIQNSHGFLLGFSIIKF